MDKQHSTPELNLIFSTVLIEEFTRLQVSTIAISPGSRSGPLTVAAARHPNIHKKVHIDERGLGYYALGAAKSTNKPAIIITTSGTALANLMPAIVEASMDHIPMIIISADRPSALYDTASNQTIDQIKIFGSYVRWFMDIPCPSSLNSLDRLISAADQSYHLATLPTNEGPVHINCHFDDPLLPKPEFMLTQGHLPIHLHQWFNDNQPFSIISRPLSGHSEEDYQTTAQQINKSISGLIVLGKIDPLEETAQLINLINKLNWPVFPDISSQLKMDDVHNTIIPHFEMMLFTDPTLKSHKFETILHVGGRINSKKLGTLLANLNACQYIRVQNTLQRDEEFRVSTIRFTSIHSFCVRILPYLKTKEPIASTSLLQKDSKEIKLRLEADTSYSEVTICKQLSQCIPVEHQLFIGNSMAIRNMQMASLFDKRSPRIFVNRGASGIDGLIATACGCAEASKTPTTILLGDSSALHDLNSLQLVSMSNIPIIVIIINNNGGAIFSSLAISKWKELVTPYFIAPHGHTFEHFAKGFNIDYTNISSIHDFKDAYLTSLGSKTSIIIECTIHKTDQ